MRKTAVEKLQASIDTEASALAFAYQLEDLGQPAISNLRKSTLAELDNDRCALNRLAIHGYLSTMGEAIARKRLRLAVAECAGK
jgi:hypothetical protein